MSKKIKKNMIEVPEEWYYQSVDNAELIGAYENQMLGMKEEIDNLNAIIEMQGEILASQGVVPAQQAFADFCEVNEVSFTPEGLPLMEIKPDEKKES